MFDVTSIQNKIIISEAKSAKKNRKFISYQILKNLTYHHGKLADCRMRGVRTFHPYLHERSGMLDFHTHIKTNLNMLYIGSSIGKQFFEALQSATISYDENSTEVIRHSWGEYHENTFISQTPDGGTLSSLRVTGLFLNKERDNKRHVAPNAGGGWLSYDVREMKRLVHTWRHVESISSAYGNQTSPCETSPGIDVDSGRADYPCEEKDFDVVVHQLPAEWTDCSKSFDSVITRDALEEIVDLSFNHLGANTVIIQTLAINNNARTLTELANVNRMIWDFTNDFESNRTKTSPIRAIPGDASYSFMQARSTVKRRVLVMDLYSYSIALYLRNSIEIGLIDRQIGEMLQVELLAIDSPYQLLNLTETTLAESFNRTMPLLKHWSWGRRNKCGHVFINKKVGHACGDINCTTQSSITVDGMHWCMRETAGRINAGLACLVQCSLIDDGADHDMRDCEKRCNYKFMSLVQIPWEKASQLEFNGTKFDGFEDY